MSRRRRPQPSDPPIFLCRWISADREEREPVSPYRRRERCRGTRLRPEGHPEGEPVLDCGAPACAARSAAYRAELAGK